MNYGYARVSTINQHLDRQIDELHKAHFFDIFIEFFKIAFSFNCL